MRDSTFEIMFLNPYLSFNGNCEEAFECYRSVFGGTFTAVMRFGEMPSDDPDPAEHRRIMHIELPVGNGSTLMGCDTPGPNEPVRAGTNFHISLQVGTRQEADRIFARLASGGKIIAPMAQTFWGAYFGMLTDRYDVQWMISCASHAAR